MECWTLVEISLRFSIFQPFFSIYFKVQSYLIVLLLRQTELKRKKREKFIFSG